MTDSSIVNLLERRGVWMTPFEIFHASPDYPLSEYVSTELAALKANGMVVTRFRPKTSLREFGLPSWVKAPEPAFSIRYFAFMFRQFLRSAMANSRTTT